MLFPTVSGENLEGRKFTLPNDLEQEKNLLILAFQREQQSEVDTWSPLVKRLTQEHTDLAYYELPVISSLFPIFQWWINAGMRTGIPDRNARRATITLYLDKQPFKQALELPDEERIYTLLVKRTGEVLWRTEGSWDQKKEHELEAIILL